MPGPGDLIARRRAAWDALSRTIDRARGGIRRLPRDELKQLGPLYRQTIADLAYARLRGADPGLIASLNDLAIRAHGLIYARRPPAAARLGRFLARGFPDQILRHRLYILLAAVLFLLGGAFAALATATVPRAGAVFLQEFGDRDEDVRFYHDLPRHLSASQRPLMAAGLMTNNLRVAILSFAVGILGGFPTLLLLFYNGLPLGALAVLQHQAGYSVALWSFLLPHAVPELSALFIAGGAGMRIGHALVAPGEWSRRDAVVIAGRDAVRLLFGTAALLVIAAGIEAFVSPSSLPPPGKFAFAFLALLGLIAYIRRGALSPRGSGA